VIVSASKEKENATKGGQESCQARTDTGDEKTAVINPLMYTNGSCIDTGKD